MSRADGHSRGRIRDSSSAWRSALRHRTLIAMAALVLASLPVPHLRAQPQEPAPIASAENALQTGSPTPSEGPNKSTSQTTSETSLPVVQLSGAPEAPAAESPAGQA